MQHEASSSPDRLTLLLAQASGGNVDALNELFPLVYDELRGLAHSRLRAERHGHTLNTTALVHEAYLKLVAHERVDWQNRAHFYAVASQAMRRILVNYAETRRTAKRGGGAQHVVLQDSMLPFTESQLDEILVLDEALDRLKEFSPRGADVVIYRFYGGLTHDEIAHVLGTSVVTVRRAWSTAKSWLRRELREGVPALESTPEPP
jgi:RNA polymerase sigma factor (TIGR02999 family)